MPSNNYRRLHRMPMVHTKRYPHQSRFKKRYGFTLSEMMDNINRFVDGMVEAVGEMARGISEWAKGIEWQKLTS